MQGEVVAEGLSFPEGPVWTSDGLFVVEILGGTVARWHRDDGLRRIAVTGGGPNALATGDDGAFLVTQNGGTLAEQRTRPGIQRVTVDGDVSTVLEEVAGLTLGAPNDLAYGPDGRLYFTDPRGEPDPAHNQLPGRLFAVDFIGSNSSLLRELGPVFPNGIAFADDGRLLWTETFARRVVGTAEGRGETILELPERHFPDGMCVDNNGRLYVACTYAHCVVVIDGDKIVERLMCGDGMPTNCCFGGTDLYVTESRHGTIWRFPLGVSPLPLHSGPTTSAG